MIQCFLCSKQNVPTRTFPAFIVKRSVTVFPAFKVKRTVIVFPSFKMERTCVMLFAFRVEQSVRMFPAFKVECTVTLCPAFRVKRIMFPAFIVKKSAFPAFRGERDVFQFECRMERTVIPLSRQSNTRFLYLMQIFGYAFTLIRNVQIQQLGTFEIGQYVTNMCSFTKYIF